jgi:hypothetical protein
MIKIVDADFKRLDSEQAAKLAELRPKLDMSKAEDRDFLERVEQQFYADAMMEVSLPYFRQTRLKAGDDWRALWKKRQAEALADSSGDREALEAAFVHLQRFEDDRDARILERVVKAKFGGEPTFILLIHWEREESVEKDLASGKEAEIGHFLIIGVRCSDRKLVSRVQCG